MLHGLPLLQSYGLLHFIYSDGNYNSGSYCANGDKALIKLSFQNFYKLWKYCAHICHVYLNNKRKAGKQLLLIFIFRIALRITFWHCNFNWGHAYIFFIHIQDWFKYKSASNKILNAYLMSKKHVIYNFFINDRGLIHQRINFSSGSTFLNPFE